MHEWMNKQLNTKKYFYFHTNDKCLKYYETPFHGFPTILCKATKANKTLIHIYDTSEECSGRALDLRSKGHRFETHRRN